MKKLNAISLATCTMFVVAALHIYLGWDDRYFLLWLKAANFINGGICKRLVNLPSTQLNNETFDLRFTTSVKECSTLPLSECIVPGRVITDCVFTDDLIRFFESNPYFHVESNKKGVLVYNKERVASIKEVKGLIDFGVRLSQAINKS